MTNTLLELSYSRMVEKVSDYAIFLTDRSGVIQTWNPAAEVMKGFSKDEAIGQHLSILYTDEDKRRNHPKHNLEDAASQGTFQESAWRKRKDGSLFWALVELIAIRNDSGELEGFCKVTRDLTNLKQLQDNLAAEKERAELILGAIADGVISVDEAGAVEYVNRQAQCLTGWSQEDAKGLRIEQVFDAVQPDWPGAGDDGPARTETGGTPSHTMLRLRTREGVQHLIEIREAEIPGREGQPGGSVIVFHDVSERQRMEGALRDADRRKDEFLAMLAHELRNPLAPVSAAAELLALGKLEAGPAKKASQVIIRQVKHMTALVDDLLDVSRVSRGQITLNMAPLDMKLVVNAAIEQVQPLIESRQHMLTLKLAPLKAYVKGDEKRLIQVIANLLNNAAKYTPPEGTISLEMSVADGNVCIIVVDNGIGIDPAIQEVVFELFEQVRLTSDRAIGGLGIGLALVRSLIHLHHGTVTCHSEGLGRGSRFIACIPSLAPDEAVPERRSVDRLVELPVANRDLSILVVDDNVDAAEMLQFFLSTMGHHVSLAHTASQALEMAQSSAPDVCILDIGLPDSSGYDLATNIRKVSSVQPALIALTGLGTMRDRNLATEVGFDHYFVKPADLDMLSEVLATVSSHNVRR
ncbi:hybrid sensor histidine kinase/response regulator [Pseudoduganella lutea]|uniref:histidine kinase n=1 Tax=Pseudoduganella lutea TaxID=321985 RepID=A0A4P6L428_9BURK|nr:PAS domain S-box protein [Pseudoduganella lutea]QBE66321.1 PAS domain S-box protein [Pseudoduganella lutea]